MIFSYLVSVDLTIIQKEFEVIFLHNCSRSKSFRGFIILCFILAFSLFNNIIGVSDIVRNLSIIEDMSKLFLFLNEVIK